MVAECEWSLHLLKLSAGPLVAGRSGGSSRGTGDVSAAPIRGCLEGESGSGPHGQVTRQRDGFPFCCIRMIQLTLWDTVTGYCVHCKGNINLPRSMAFSPQEIKAGRACGLDFLCKFWASVLFAPRKPHSEITPTLLPCLVNYSQCHLRSYTLEPLPGGNL